MTKPTIDDFEKSKDPSHIGDIAAQQPLSGLRVVSAMSVKGFNGPTAVQIDDKDSKKSA